MIPIDHFTINPGRHEQEGSHENELNPAFIKHGEGINDSPEQSSAESNNNLYSSISSNNSNSNSNSDSDTNDNDTNNNTNNNFHDEDDNVVSARATLRRRGTATCSR